jgi:pimeloyl-ACP methyl ester carboxylesterase
MLDPHPLLGRDVVVDGVRLHVVAHGRTGGVPLLLLHGVPTSSYLWRNVMRDLESKVPTVAPDLVGLGRSERPRRRGYRLTEQAALLHGLLDELALPRVVVAGHDEGGAVALQLAAMAPDRVTGIALLGSPLHAHAWPPPAVVPLLLPGVGEAYAALLRRSQHVARRLVGRLSARELGHYRAPLRAPDGARSLLRLVRAMDLRETATALEILGADCPPVLVLWGTEDQVRSAAYGRRLADELPGAVFVPVSGGGHLLPEECPERVAEELAGFVAELPVALSQSADQ